MSAIVQKHPLASNSVFEVADVTPAQAQAWLQTNHLNRPIRPRKVVQYAQDMESGRWKESFDPIRFGKSGRLIDGQHRLHAVMLANMTVRLFIVRGVDDSAFDVFDNGAARTLADMLSLEGHEPWIAKTAATAAQMALSYDDGKLPTAMGYPNNVCLQYIHEHPELIASTAFLDQMPRHGVPLSHSCGAFLHFVFVRHDGELAENFIRRFYTGENLVSGDVVLELRNRLISRKISGTKSTKLDDMWACVKVWNSVRRQKPIKWIANAFHRAGDKFPEIV